MKALALFGSTARSDRELGSDIDMIGIYNGAGIQSKNKSLISLFLYPEELLISKMETGDLFALHLVKESTPIYGRDIFEKIFNEFRYKNTYENEILQSIFLAKKIIAHYETLSNKGMANKKIAWCLRTLIIAISAQERNPVFSKKSISEYVKIESISPKDILNIINFKEVSFEIPNFILSKALDFFVFFEKKYTDKYFFYQDAFVIESLEKLGIIKSKKCISSIYYE